MKVKNLSFLLLSLLLVSCAPKEEIPLDYSSNGYSFVSHEEDKVSVTFFYNFNKQEINLNSGLYATGNSLAFKIDTYNVGEKIIKPDLDPLRRNYVFDGWHLSMNEDSLWDFDNGVVSESMYLYAHWKQEEGSDFEEPEYIEPSKIDDSLSNLAEVNGVLNMPVDDGQVLLSSGAIARLTKDSDDVINCLNYKMKSDVEVSATYSVDTKVINFIATKGEDRYEVNITIKDASPSLVIGNSTYENKAVKYEQNSIDFEDHRIMLAGSSSMENWSTSTEDLLPLKTYNHGIGGTTVDQWRDKLNQRLVYPYSPKIVVYYVGVNNLINTGDDAATTSQYLVEMFDDVHAHLPDTKIYYVLINALPGYMSYLSAIKQVNDTAIKYEEEHEYVTTLDAGNLLLKENGEPNAAFFLTDGLHMSKYGYVLWGGFIKNKLIEDMSSNA